VWGWRPSYARKAWSGVLLAVDAVSSEVVVLLVVVVSGVLLAVDAVSYHLWETCMALPRGYRRVSSPRPRFPFCSGRQLWALRRLPGL
jgi:hypothetical protein